MSQSLMADAVVTFALLLALGIAISASPSGGPGVNETNATITGQIDPPPGEPSAPILGPQGQYVYPSDVAHSRSCSGGGGPSIAYHDLPLDQWWSP